MELISSELLTCIVHTQIALDDTHSDATDESQWITCKVGLAVTPWHGSYLRTDGRFTGDRYPDQLGIGFTSRTDNPQRSCCLAPQQN